MEPKIYTRNTMHRRVAGKTPEGKEAGEADEMDQAELADSDPNQERWRHDNGEGYEDGERHPGVEQGWWCSPVPGGVLDARPGTGLRRPAPLHSQPRGRLGHVQLRGPRGPQPRRARWPSPGKLRRR
ncbi:uncharacterized protein AAG666_023222 isoform 3-T19 [Megaptera novaeangliae]